MNEKKKGIISIIILLFIQALIYWLIKFVQGTPHLIGTNFDMNFPFCKYFVYIYNSWYPFLFFCWYKLYKNDKKIYKRLYIASLISIIIGNIIFIAYPTTIERANFIVNDLSSFILNITYKLDTPVNCCPSMHCMFCFITSYSVLKSNLKTKDKLFIIIYSLLIILSTLFIKQHVIYDVIASYIISIICYYFLSRLKIFNNKENL